MKKPALTLRRRELCLALPLAGLLPRRGHASGGLEIGVLPNISARLLMAQYQPMREFLQRELGCPVQVSTAPNWPSFHQRTLALEYDLVVTAAHLARVAQVDKGCVPLLMMSPQIKGLAVVCANKPLKSMSELRGQSLVLSNPQSLVTLRGLSWLAVQGLQRGRDYQTVATPTDDSVGNVLLRGDAVVALCSAGEFRAIPEGVRNQLQVMSTFTEVPGFVVMASPRLGAPETARVRQQLLQFAQGSEEGKAYFTATGFQGLREVPAGLMESLEVYADATRRLLQSGA